MDKVLVPATKPTTVTIIVDPELRDELTQAARENERSLGAEVRFALRRHLERDHHQEAEETR